MTARFDPVRDSAASPTKKYSSIEQRRRTSEEYHEALEREDDAMARRPIRKASIADLLNEEPPRPSRASVSGDYADVQYNDNRDGRMQKQSSSPLPSAAGLPNSGPGYEQGSSYRYEGSTMHRQSSSHSNSSSLDQSLHPHQGSQSSHQHSPSMLHLLNSSSQRNLSNSPSSLERPRSRGPSFAGNADILSPNNEEISHHRHSSSSHFEYRKDEVNHYVSPLQHQIHDSHRHPSQSSGHSFFAVPDVPYRSPDTLRIKKSLPSSSTSTESTLPRIMSHHLRSQEMGDAREAKPLLLQQPLTPGGGQADNFMHVPGAPRYYSPYGASSASSRELTPSRSVQAPPLSPMEVPPTPGEYIHSERHYPGYFTSQESAAASDYHCDAHVMQSWSDRDDKVSSEAKRTLPSQSAPDHQEIIPAALPPAKRRKKSLSSKALGALDSTNEAQSQQDTDSPALSEQPKRGRPKGRKSVSNGIGSKIKVDATNANALSDIATTSEKMNAQTKVDKLNRTISDVDMVDAKVDSMITPSSITPIARPSTPKTAYRPTKRVSIPTTIRMPVTAKQVDEMRFQCQNSLRSKWQSKHPTLNDGFDIIVANFASQMSVASSSKVAANGESNIDVKRKREAIEREESNAALVAQHYNSRQDQGLSARKQSPILPLRTFNNWIKSVIIGSHATRHGRVLDLGGGKGGDLNKWDKAQIDEYILCDIAEISIQQAESRYKERRYHFNARFFSFDCFAFPLADNIPKEILDPLFDTVSLQFCLHYGWETVQKAQLMLENISRYLKPGGIFVGTIPNADLLRNRLTEAMQATPLKKTSFGNQYYEVMFGMDDEKNTKCPPFGHKYKFTLLDAVDDVAEYVVDWNQLVSLANQNGLDCIFKKTFEEIWQNEGQLDQNHQELAKRMKIYPNGPDGLPMNAELWEATSLYIAFAFEKKSHI